MDGLCFFFFKQKTAYEMRISDWSSDVCSSDLTYLRAFAAIERFEGRAALSTWLTRIAINEALGRKRAAERRRASLDGNSVTMLDDYREKLMQGSIQGTSPERMHARAELRRLMESAIAALPETFRLVFVLREIEEQSVEEIGRAHVCTPVINAPFV